MSMGQNGIDSVLDDITLLADEVFQLNMFLWALEPLPPDGPIRPVLRTKGYRLLAIGRKVLMPASRAVSNALQQLVGSPDRSAPRPDLWLRNVEHPVHLIVEHKGQSFSPQSSKPRRQAIKLLISTLDLAPSLGEGTPRSGHLIYGTTATDASDMATTLKQLADQVKGQGVAPAPTAVIGLSIDDNGVALSSPKPSDLPNPVREAMDTPLILLPRQGDNDFRPLYLIPWIPGIEENQNSQLNQEGLQELTARVLSHTQGYIGRASLSTDVVLKGEELLSEATFGIFDKWKDDNRHQFSNAVVAIVAEALNAYQGIQKNGKRLDVRLDSEEDRKDVIQLLKRANPYDPALTRHYGQLPLFDT